MSTPRTQPNLGDVADLARQLARDAEASGSSLRHRDRNIGRELARLEGRPLPLLMAWLDRVRAGGGERLGSRVLSLHRLGMAVLGLIGLALGWGTAAVVFHYDGTHPVNVINVLAVFVLLPIVLLLGFSINLLPSGALRRLPGFGAAQEAIGLLGPGRLQRWLARFLPQEQRHSLARLVAGGGAHGRLYGTVERWVVVHSSQVFALAFHLGALASALYLVVFSDLAFAWSTTLAASAGDMQRWTDALSLPWAWAWPEARPSAELVAMTRYYRLGEGTFPQAASPAGLGGWWPFLILCMAVYGVAPRLATLAVARLRLRAALRRTVLHLPGSREVLERLTRELVETRAEAPELGAARPAGEVRIAGATDLAGHAAEVIDWARAADDPAATAGWLTAVLGVRVGGWHHSGGGRTLSEDATARAAALAADAEVVVLVKAWEPPVGELLDFLRALRSEADRDRTVHVLPIGAAEAPASAPAAVAARQLRVWRRALAELGDPRLRLIQPEGGPS